MATNLETKIGRIRNNVTSALAKIAEKGVTVPEGAGSDDLEGLIDAITGGGGGGALPAGISAIDSGTYTATEDKTYGTIPINHELGIAPNFIFFCRTNIPDTGEDLNYLTFSISLLVEYVKGDKTYPAVTLRCTSTSTSPFSTSIMNELNIAQFRETLFRVEFTSAARLKAGETYRWVVGTIDGIS